MAYLDCDLGDWIEIVPEFIKNLKFFATFNIIILIMRESWCPYEIKKFPLKCHLHFQSFCIWMYQTFSLEIHYYIFLTGFLLLSLHSLHKKHTATYYVGEWVRGSYKKEKASPSLCCSSVTVLPELDTLVYFNIMGCPKVNFK